MTDHQWLDLAAPYALDALAADERAAFEAHLAECATCRAEVQTLRDVAGLLAHAAPAAPLPPPRLRDRILREARQVRTISARRAPVVPWLVAAACLAIAVGLGGAYRHERAARNVLRGALEAARAQRDSADQLVAAILDSTVGTADLAAAGKAPTMRLYWNRARGVVVAAAFDLPPAPAGRTFQLWVIKKGQNPVSLGTFNTTPTGRAIVTLAVPAGLKADLGAVTEEPAGGSPQPTQTPFLAGAWQGI